MEEDLMKRHKAAKLVDFVPYWCRPSEGDFLRTMRADGTCVVQMTVLGLGELFITADGVGPGNEARCRVIEDLTT